MRHYIRRNNFDWLEYHPENHILDISFMSGGLHSFAQVSPESFEAFLATDDKTEFFLRQLKPVAPLVTSKGKG